MRVQHEVVFFRKMSTDHLVPLIKFDVCGVIENLFCDKEKEMDEEDDDRTRE